MHTYIYREIIQHYINTIYRIVNLPILKTHLFGKEIRKVFEFKEASNDKKAYTYIDFGHMIVCYFPRIQIKTSLMSMRASTARALYTVSAPW